MAASLHELFAGRTETLSGNKSKAEMHYVVLDAADEAEVHALALAQVPPGYAGLFLTSITLDERLNETTWKVTVSYEAPEAAQQDNPEPTFAFDTGGGSQHITQSLQTVGRYGPSQCRSLSEHHVK